MRKFIHLTCLLILLTLFLLGCESSEKDHNKDKTPQKTSSTAPTRDYSLLTHLAYIPDMEIIRANGVTYANYDVLLKEWNAYDFTSQAEYEDINDNPPDEATELQGGTWLWAMWGLMSGLSRDLNGSFMIPTKQDHFLEDSGFNLFQTISASEASHTLVILEGSFNVQSIIAAYQSQGYTPQEKGEFILLCGMAGCDLSGVEANDDLRADINIFGAERGFQYPILVSDTLIISSPKLDQLSPVLEANSPTLADASEYQAVVNTIRTNGELIQIHIYDATNFESENPSSIFPNKKIMREEQKAQIDLLDIEYQILPRFDLIGVAELVQENEQIALIVLVYPDTATAHQALPILQERMNGYALNAANLVNSSYWAKSLVERFNDLDATIDDPLVYEDSATDRGVIVIRIHAPLPPVSPEMPTNLVFRRLIEMFITRDVGWLTVPTAE